MARATFEFLTLYVVTCMFGFHSLYYSYEMAVAPFVGTSLLLGSAWTGIIGVFAVFLFLVGGYCWFSLLRVGDKIELLIARVVGIPHPGWIYESLLTVFQVGRAILCDDDSVMAIYICNMYLLVLLSMDMFGRRNDRKNICRKIAKRSMYAFLISLYQKRIYTINVFHFSEFPLPGWIISLLPTALSGYMEVFCCMDAPQHQFVTDWFGWRGAAAARDRLMV